VDVAAPYFLFSPWASARARTYSPTRFARAARELAWVSGWSVVMTGAEKDRQRSSRLEQILGPYGVDVTGATSFTELAALVSGARMVLTNNTAAMHLAAAADVPALVAYSGTELDSQWRPRFTPHRLLRRPTWCSPCYAFECPYDRECLDFPPEELVEAGLELLRETSREAGGLRQRRRRSSAAGPRVKERRLLKRRAR
jgi:ADP-heptose:LPS heptosyltransferase